MSNTRGKKLYTAEYRSRTSPDTDPESVSTAAVLQALNRLGDMMRGVRAAPPAPRRTVNPEIATISTELNDMSHRIRQMKAEVGAIKHPLATTDRIKTATSELGTIVDDMEVATDRILGGAEQVEATLAQMLVFSGGSNEIAKLNDEAVGQLTRMMEACSFQDVSGQRVSKVVRLFDDIETHITSIIDVLGPEAFADIPVKDNDGPAPEGVTLHGPQSAGGGISQDEIDALFD